VTRAEIERELEWRYAALRELRVRVEEHERAVTRLQRERKELTSTQRAAEAAEKAGAQ